LREIHLAGRSVTPALLAEDADGFQLRVAEQVCLVQDQHGSRARPSPTHPQRSNHYKIQAYNADPHPNGQWR